MCPNKSRALSKIETHVTTLKKERKWTSCKENNVTTFTREIHNITTSLASSFLIMDTSSLGSFILCAFHVRIVDEKEEKRKCTEAENASPATTTRNENSSRIIILWHRRRRIQFKKKRVTLISVETRANIYYYLAYFIYMQNDVTMNQFQGIYKGPPDINSTHMHQR